MKTYFCSQSSLSDNILNRNFVELFQSTFSFRMKAFKILPSLALFVAVVNAQTTQQQCASMCNFGTPSTLFVDMYRSNLIPAGPVDGFCPPNQLKWQISGTMYNLDDKCCCLPIFYNPKINSRSKGYYKCPQIIPAQINETLSDFFVKNFANAPPTDGYCSTGKIKYVYNIPSFGYKRPGCFCFDPYHLIDYPDYSQRF